MTGVHACVLRYRNVREKFGVTGHGVEGMSIVKRVISGSGLVTANARLVRSSNRSALVKVIYIPTIAFLAVKIKRLPLRDPPGHFPPSSFEPQFHSCFV